MIQCSRCDEKAKRVLVTYYHDIVGEGEFFCERHAFEDNREECPCCDDYWIDVGDIGPEGDEELLPTYPEGTLDSDGCCSEHP